MMPITLVSLRTLTLELLAARLSSTLAIFGLRAGSADAKLGVSFHRCTDVPPLVTRTLNSNCRIAAIIHYSLFKIHHSAAGGQPRSGYLSSTCTALRPMEKSPVVSFDAVILI